MFAKYERPAWEWGLEFRILVRLESWWSFKGLWGLEGAGFREPEGTGFGLEKPPTSLARGCSYKSRRCAV